MSYLLGFDPGRDKCGLAVLNAEGTLHHHQVVLTAEVLSAIQSLRQDYPIARIVLGDQTSARDWRQRLQENFSDLPITLVDERYSSLEARDRYWQMYPPQGLMRLVPQGLRQVPRPIDDIVAILLVERYFKSKQPV